MSAALWRFTGGLPETPCGFGSKVESTVAVRKWLPQLFSDLRVRSVLDAPCGDFNWMAHVDLTGIDYIGIDGDRAMVQSALRKRSRPGMAPASKTVIHADLLDALLPCDLIICRDFLQHLPTVEALRALELLRRTEARYIAVTCHDNEINGEIERRGDFRPLNLLRPPFNWRQPLRSCADGDNRVLAVWML